MSRALMERCLTDPVIGKAVRGFAYWVAHCRPNSMDREDAEQDIWEAIFKALPRYDGSKTLTEFALSVAYSKRGHMTSHRINHANYLNEDALRYTSEPVGFGSVDEGFSQADAVLTLDRIEEDILIESRRSHQFRIVLDSFRLLRTGMNQSQAARRLRTTRGCICRNMRRLRESVIMNRHR